MESFISGFWLGIGAAVPIGPINVMIMQESLKRYTPAVAIGAGAMSADLSYLSLILIGVMGFAHNKIFITSVGLFGSVFLLYMAWSIFGSLKEPVKRVDLKELDTKSLGAFWLKGYLMTLLNPYTVLFWLSLSAYIGTKGLDPLFTIIGLLSAISMWIILMPYAIYKSKHLISQRVAEILSMVSAIILLFFALSMIYNVMLEIAGSV